MSVYTAKSLPAIGYAYDALEPHIDAATMELHHSKHHQAYTDNMNKALATLSATEAFTSKASAATIDDLLRAIAREDAGKTEPLPWPTPQVRAAIRNHGGGFVNHAVYFANMSPTPAPFDPSSPFGKAVVEQFASLDAFKEQFTAAALGLFGSGWVFLALHPSTKRLQIVSTANQDIPEFASGLAGSGVVAILALDVWEHAYYVKYRNVRANYVAAWWNVVNWADVASRFNGEHAKL